MGLPMEDIHTPTVPSGPTTKYGSANGDKHDRLSLLDLIAEKDRVEAELSALGSVLDSVCAHLPSGPLAPFRCLHCALTARC